MSFKLYAHVLIHDQSTIRGVPDYPGSHLPEAPDRIFEPPFCRHVLVGEYGTKNQALGAMQSLKYVEVAPNEYVLPHSILHFHIVSA